MKRIKSALGFTLMEVLIAMTLLSIMVVLLFASLKICAQSWEKGESKMADVNEVAVVYHFFQQHLTAAKPLWDDFSVKEQRTLAFQGDTQSLQFVGEFPASVGKIGAQLFSLHLQELDDGNVINVAITPFLPVPDGQSLPKEEIALIKHVRSISLAYFGPDETGGESSWQTQWLQRENQPQLVKVSIELENASYWPDMIVELKVADAPIDAEGNQANGQVEENGQDPQDPQNPQNLQEPE
ncbi:MAG: prepilin-type N-terminal cleavage/methylation domain-containing protein [Methylovulum sp.]|uniref:prepilin-type N-terminal cleavage/methylation domain-containing protein n=1 Tax=Methylovulum sp. TaxID=1916980 RepID=UPI0026045656|nr:prepilin-type N-terminal cleavage/methylation domain-containing protein [Methylovulum sp.]MDD2725146.1 prepilin-type N-terminal cleavage/methylation domain-containing protein [Methylovulum sp.]MDD5125402.1 prepilin-type N-terminal cleavage/methylation domain-containing protein [Methylovulum sp.]